MCSLRWGDESLSGSRVLICYTRRRTSPPPGNSQVLRAHSSLSLCRRKAQRAQSLSRKVNQMKFRLCSGNFSRKFFICHSHASLRIKHMAVAKVNPIITRVPIQIAGLMLGLAAAGNLVSPHGSFYKYVFGVLSAVILLVLMIKLVFMPQSVAEGFEDPLTASVMPTFGLSLMVLSTYVQPYFFAAACCIWMLGLTTYAALVFCFTKKYILNFNIKRVFPSYFVVYVGTACGSMTVPSFGLAYLGQFLFWLGFASYLILLPLIIYRVMVIKEIPEPALPTIGIFASPASLCLAGYLHSFQGRNMTMVVFLTSLSLAMLVLAMSYIPKILRLKFSPSYSALTFPFVATATAMKGTYALLVKAGKAHPLFMYLTGFLEIWAITMVLYVLLRYTMFIFSASDEGMDYDRLYGARGDIMDMEKKQPQYH